MSSCCVWLKQPTGARDLGLGSKPVESCCGRVLYLLPYLLSRQWLLPHHDRAADRAAAAALPPG